ncbi:MAG: RsbRD N-terminal domain-containing protein [Chloroflexota bacterium]|nr:RsbRD N-terminal domain-containing protein [Chloroflexota bacterium]
MNPALSDRMVEVLTAHRNAMVAEYLRQVQAAVPRYAALSAAELVPSFEVLFDTIIAALRERDVSILARLLERATYARIAQGFSGESQITASRLIEGIIRDTLRQDLTGDPPALANALRRVDQVAATSRAIVGRILLAQLTEPPPE